MFGFLKRKLGDVVKKFSKGVEDESELIDQKDVQDELILNTEKDVVIEKEEKIKVQKDKKQKDVQTEEKLEKLEDKKEIKEVKKEEEVLSKDKVQEESPSKIKEKKLEVNKKDLEENLKEKKQTSEINLSEESEEFKHSDKEIPEQELAVEEPKSRGFFSRITDTFTKVHLSEEKFEDLFWDLEVTLLENNVAMEVIQKIKDDLKHELTQDKISRKKAQDIVLDSLRKSIKEVLSVEKIDLLKKINNKKPFIIVVIGVNGSGKTTTIAKLCHYLKKQNKTLVLAAADTFRAAAIQQIEHHANTLDIKLIKHDYNSDPSAVAFDAIRHAEAKQLDVVIIDTAGRLHSNDNLMNELKKLVRVNAPDLKLFVGESITGNDCVEQAKKYDEIIGIDAIILSKADIDEKGGAALSISYVTKKPVLFIGTGQEYDDLEVYDEQKIMDNLGI